MASTTIGWSHEAPDRLWFRPVGEPPRLIARGPGAGMNAAGMRFSRVPRGNRLNVGDLLQGAGRRHHGQTAWNQEVARVPVSHIFYLTGCGDVGDVFLEEYLHALVIE